MDCRFAVDASACGVRRAVCAVRTDADQHHVLYSVEDRRGGERELLVAPALAVSGEFHHRFAAHDEGTAHAIRRMRAHDLGEAASRHAGFVGDGRIEDLGRETARGAGRCRGGAELADASRDYGFHVRDGAGRFLGEAGEDAGG